MQTLSNRRQFLRVIGVLPFGASMARGAADPPATPSGWPLRLATSSVMFPHLAIEEVCRRVAGLGLTGIDIWCPFGACRHLDDVNERLGAGGLKELLDQHRLKLCAFSVYGVGLARYTRLIREFGGGIAVRESQYGQFPKDGLSGPMRTFFENLKPAIDEAAACHARLAIENHGSALLDSIDSLKAFVDLNPAPDRVGIALAPYHLQARRASVEAAIAVCGSQLLFFYAWQKADNFDQLPGHGPTEFAPWLEALAAIGYPHHVTIFMHGEPPADAMANAVAQARDYLRARQPSRPGRPR